MVDNGEIWCKFGVSVMVHIHWRPATNHLARRFNPPLRQNSGWTPKILTWVFPNIPQTQFSVLTLTLCVNIDLGQGRFCCFLIKFKLLQFLIRHLQTSTRRHWQVEDNQMAQKCSQQQQTGGAGSRTTTNIHIITNIQRQIQTQYELKLQIHKYITYTPALSNQPRGGASSKALCYTL